MEKDLILDSSRQLMVISFMKLLQLFLKTDVDEPDSDSVNISLVTSNFLLELF